MAAYTKRAPKDVLLDPTYRQYGRMYSSQYAFCSRNRIVSATFALGIPAVCEIIEFVSRKGLWFLKLPHLSMYCPSGFAAWSERPEVGRKK